MRTLWLAPALWLLVGQAMGPAAAGALTAEQEMELKMFTGQLADAARSVKTKAEAAELLLARRYPEAAEALRKFLEDASNRPAQIAVAEAIARGGAESQAFIEPLLAMLTGAEPTVRAPAARALVTYKDQAVTAKLIAIALDRSGDQAVRLVTISALQRVLDRQAVDALVRLVGDRDTAIRNAAADSLAKLTNIRTFGGSPGKWRKWWANSKNKPASEWLADLAESLGREKARLEDENTKLRQRLATAMMDFYAATAIAQQDKLLADFLKDPLADVRLVGVNLAARKVSTNGKVTDELRAQVRAMLTDEDPRVRRVTALLAANVGDPNAVDVLLARLKVEEVPEVKQGLLTALGQVPDARALKPILAEVLS
ncbi:MAG: HEAT repeat domain-containing protein, partial [Phycisphaerae bacterium]